MDHYECQSNFGEFAHWGSPNCPVAWLLMEIYMLAVYIHSSCGWPCKLWSNTLVCYGFISLLCCWRERKKVLKKGGIVIKTFTSCCFCSFLWRNELLPLVGACYGRAIPLSEHCRRGNITLEVEYFLHLRVFGLCCCAFAVKSRRDCIVLLLKLSISRLI